MSSDSSKESTSDSALVVGTVAGETTGSGAEIVLATVVTNSTLASPQLLHPASILFEGMALFRRYLVPTLLAGFSAASGNTFWVAFSAIFFLIALAFTSLRYVTLRYAIRDGDLVVTEGLFFRRLRTVPVRRIQNVDLTQSVLHRLFQVAEVRIETAGGSEPESTLRVLSMTQVDQLRSSIFAHSSRSLEKEPATSNGKAIITDPNATVQASSKELLLAMETRWLIQAGLCSNRGTFAVAFIAGILFQGEWWEQRELFKTIWRFVPKDNNWVANAFLGLSLFLLAMVALRVFSIVWYILRFHGYRLERHGDDLRISCGLFTKISATVPRRRIQLISIHRPLLYRYLGLSSIRVETAGGSDGEKDDTVSSVGRTWFVPVVATERVRRLIAHLRPGLDWDESSQTWCSPSRHTAARLSRASALVSLLICLVGLTISRPWGFVPGLVICPVLLLFAIKKSRAHRYAHTAFGIVFRSGLLTRKVSMTFFDRIQALELRQSPFDRRWQMASLYVDTAGAGPAAHPIEVPYLDANLAKIELERLQIAASSHVPLWQ